MTAQMQKDIRFVEDPSHVNLSGPPCNAFAMGSNAPDLQAAKHALLPPTLCS